MELSPYIKVAAQLMELAGVGTMLGGVVVALVFSVLAARQHGRSHAYREFRQQLGRGILLGLEFLVAADIIRTVSEAPTLKSVSVLGAIVLIRTFLSFTLAVELEGRWPWQRGVRESGGPAGRAP